MSRVSRGCLPCRTRRVKCDQGRPSCRRCVQRGETCTGYRDDFSLVFRNENDKAARKSLRRRASTESSSRSGISSQASSVSGASSAFMSAEDPSDLSDAVRSSLNLSPPFSWTKNLPPAAVPSAEDHAVSHFFEKYVMYPCNDGSSPGFLEHLPVLFEEVKAGERLALRWAVRAAAYASLSKDQDNAALGNHALKCYGLALSAIRDALAAPHTAPDDYILMTVVILDLFETLYLQDPVLKGSHAQGMAQILRLRGSDQVYGARGWSLFRLSHHRLQRQQLISKQGTLPESEAWLESLNDELPYVRFEKDTFQINKICERARHLRKSIKDSDLSAEQTFDMVKEMHDLDQVASTWRQGPSWAYKTIHRSEITQDRSIAHKLPEFVQLHRDVWIAYEWNYHRTARIILHEQLLECLDRLQSVYSGSQGPSPMDLCLLKEASISIIRALVDEVLFTVPQSLGDVDHEGNIMHTPSPGPNCQAVGGYFLLWSIKTIKVTRSATEEQREVAKEVFERIRECTGMKSALGELSSI